MLHQAIKNRDLEIVNKILNQNEGWKATDNYGNTVLHLAFSNKNRILEEQQKIIQILESFLNVGLSINIKNESGKTILYSAVEHRLRHVIDFLVWHGTDLNVRDKNGNSVVHFLIEDQFIKYSGYCDIRKPLEYRETFEHGDIDFMIFLLAKGIDVDCRNNSGKTCLDLTINCNLQHIMPILIRHMNDVTYLDEDGRSLIEVFFSRKKNMGKKVMDISINPGKIFTTYNMDYKLRYEIDIAKFLLNKGVSVNNINKQSNTLVHTFLKKYIRSYEIILWMLQRYTSIDVQDKDGNTALHLVITNSRGFSLIKFVCMLLSKKANVHLKNHQGDTAVRLALQLKQLDILKVLKLRDLSPSKNGGNLLFQLFFENRRYIVTVKKTYAPMVDILVRAGNSVNEVKGGRLPLYEAIKNLDLEGIQAMLEFGATINDEGVLREIRVIKELTETEGGIKTYEDVINFLTKHWIKLKVLSVPVVDGFTVYVSGYDYQQFRNECLQEVEKLKEHWLDGRMTLYNLLQMDVRLNCVLIVNNKALSKLVKSPSLANSFPKYHTLILASHNVARNALDGNY